jgi:hypothetical protein
MKKFSYMFLATLFVSPAFSQDNMFLVYSIKGNVSVVENKVESKARIGTLLNNASVLKIPAGSFATLICNETRMFTLNKSGNYNLGNLKDSCKGSNSSVSANYMKYIWNEMTKSKGSPEKNRKAFMANVGAVSRSINNIWIDPKLDTVNYVSGTIPLSWKSYTDAEKFEFKLYAQPSGGNAIFTKLTDKKHVPVSELLKIIQPGKVYYWTAMVKDETNDDRKYLHYWPKEEYINYYNSIKKPEGANETEAEMNFRLGFVLEEAHFLAEAYQHYQKATQLAPAIPLYRFVFMSFKKDYEIK